MALVLVCTVLSAYILNFTILSSVFLRKIITADIGIEEQTPQGLCRQRQRAHVSRIQPLVFGKHCTSDKVHNGGCIYLSSRLV